MADYVKTFMFGGTVNETTNTTEFGFATYMTDDAASINNRCEMFVGFVASFNWTNTTKYNLEG